MLRRMFTSIYPRVVLFVVAVVGLSFYLTGEMKQSASREFVKRELVDLRDETGQLAYQVLDALDNLQDDLELHGEVIHHAVDSLDVQPVDLEELAPLIEMSSLQDRDYLLVKSA